VALLGGDGGVLEFDEDVHFFTDVSPAGPGASGAALNAALDALEAQLAEEADGSGIAAALAAPPPPPPPPPGKRTSENIRQKTYLGTSAPSPGGKGGAPALGASPADGSPTGQFEDF
jgi:hypothetical protein